MPCDGTWPTATTQYEKRNIAVEVPLWDANTCIQCGQCSLVCPHASIRMKIVDKNALAGAPDTLQCADAVGKEFKGRKFVISVSTEDCNGCSHCVSVCPGRKKDANGKKSEDRALAMAVNSEEIRRRESGNYAFFLTLPELDYNEVKSATIKGSQLLRPLFEYPGACVGCGETPYIKLATQLFGDRMMIANATGCSSIYGGNLPTTPYCKRDDGRGPIWANSLFEDNAEFGFGMRQTVNKMASQATELLAEGVIDGVVSQGMVDELLNAPQTSQVEIEAQRGRVAELKKVLEGSTFAKARQLLHVADFLVKKSVWIFGGDGWAYDIGYGGLDHVLASGENVNILVMDTEVYSNTGGQMSKSTPRAATAQFAAGGKRMAKKDIGMIFATYGNVFVAKVAMGANPAQVVKAFNEAEAYDGPSIIIAYSHCINHGINMAKGLEQQKKAVECGHWPLYRYNPQVEEAGGNPLTIDSKAPAMPFSDYAMNENRYRALKLTNPGMFDELMGLAQKDVDKGWKFLTGRAKSLEPGQD